MAGDSPSGEMRVLVTGATGYLGRVAVPRLADRGLEVVAASRAGWPVEGAAHCVALDIRDGTATDRVLGDLRPEAVLHLAASIPRGAETVEDRRQSRAVNRDGTRYLAAAALRHGVRRFVLASSISVYGDTPAGGVAFREDDPLRPRGAYGQDKAAAEEVVASLLGDAREVVILRIAGIHGPPRRSGVLWRFCASAVAGDPLHAAEPGSTFNLLSVEDAAAACRAAVLAPLGSGTHRFNIAGAEVVTLESLARRVSAAAGSGAPVTLGDGPTRRQVMRIDAARTALGYAPAPLGDLIGNTLCVLRGVPSA